MSPDQIDRPSTATCYPTHTHSPTNESLLGNPGDRVYDAGPAIRYITSRCGDRSLAEDITQEAILTILSKTELRREWRSLDLLFRVALNEYSNQKRKAEGRSAYMREMPSGDSLLTTSDPRAPDFALAIDVRDALARLDPEKRALILQWWNGFSYSEMAKEKGVSESTIGTQLSRAREKFAEELQGYPRRDAD